MVMPSRRSRTLRRIYVRTPRGTKVHFRKRKPAKVLCSKCGTPLAGVPRQRPKAMMKLAKTKKRPERPMGGILCSACMRRSLIAKARSVQ